MFLTKVELIEFTGYRQAKKQCEHLKAQRIPFHTNCHGEPRVARAILEGGKVSKPKPEKWSPSWAASPQ